ncbi:hypothetical protein SB781_38925, partial [Paraburkholderia sp. SIMBA_061]
GALKTTPAEALERVNALLDERKKLERELADARKKLALGGGSADGGSAVEAVNGVNFIGKIVTGVSPRDLKPLADEGKKQV